MVGAGLVGGKLHLIAGSFPAGLLTAPLHIAVGVLHIGGKGHLVAYRGRVGSTDGDGGRVSLHGDFDLRGGEGAVDLDARLDGVLARIGAGEGEGAAVCGGEADRAGEGVFAGADPFLCGVLRGIGGIGEDGEVVGSVGGGVVDR